MKGERQTKARKEAPVPAKGKRAAGPALEGRRRVVIEHVSPEIDGGRFPIKRVVGESVVVEADVFADGHDEIAGALRYRGEGTDTWSDVPLVLVENDRWRASFDVTEQGIYYYTVIAWVDHFRSWQRDMRKRVAAGQDVTVDLMIGRDLVKAAAQNTAGNDGGRLAEFAASMENGGDRERILDLALGQKLTELMTAHAARPWPTVY
ncbi:MAG TPA: maltotransferase domain-containing protein, partial [Nitrospiraceae bacterium]|nr:maltotransferase domain-containing protein [Nitrospiraceae bacterium]